MSASVAAPEGLAKTRDLPKVVSLIHEMDP